MNIIKLLTSKKFEKLDQFQRRKLLKNYILQDKDCRKGVRVLCFEKETVIDEKYKFFIRKYGKIKQITLTIGKEYEILDHKEGLIKIENDEGKKLWFTLNRFLHSLKLVRKEKLKKLNNLEEN
jgi:hypothetical protein